MFKQATTEKFWATVKAEYQKEDGARGTVSFEVQYKRLPRRKWWALMEANKGVDDADLNFAREVVCDWRRVPDDDGAEVPFSVEKLDEMYDLGFCTPIILTYIRANPQAKEKN